MQSLGPLGLLLLATSCSKPYPGADALPWDVTFPAEQANADRPSAVALGIADGGNFELHLPRNGERGKVTRVERSGEPLWSITTEGPFSSGCGGALARSAGRLFVLQHSPWVMGGSVLALDSETGSELWRAEIWGFGARDHSLYWQQLTAKVVDDALVVYGENSSNRFIEVYAPTGERLSTRSLAFCAS